MVSQRNRGKRQPTIDLDATLGVGVCELSLPIIDHDRARCVVECIRIVRWGRGT